MIILFTSSISILIVNNKKEELNYLDMIIYLGQKVELLLNTTMPETNEILSLLKNDSKLSNFDINELPLKSNENEKIREFFSSIGKYDIDSQISITKEFTEDFKLIKGEYQKQYSEHYKIYISFGVFAGIIVSIIII